MAEKKNYWGYRIDRDEIDFFTREIKEDRLRQGWGHNKGQDLRKYDTPEFVDEDASGNLRMFREVKKGDILFVHYITSWKVGIVEATEDWDTGYRFEISKEHKDYGHIFPAKCRNAFEMNNEHVTGNLRRRLGLQRRFWQISYPSVDEDVDNLLSRPKNELEEPQTLHDRLQSAVGTTFNALYDEKKFTNDLYKKIIDQFARAEWEYPLVEVLGEVYSSFDVERVGGRKEVEHGTDILMSLPGLSGNPDLAIAIQVKDWEGKVSDQKAREAFDQINMADEYWKSGGYSFVAKWVILTKAPRKENSELPKIDRSVKVIFPDDLEKLLVSFAKKIIGRDWQD